MPTMSSFLGSLNTTSPIRSSSPPNTRWSNCRERISPPCPILCGPKESLDEFALAGFDQIEQRAMPAAPGGDESLVHRIGSVISEYPPLDIGQSAACFVHQKVGRRKVPIAARRRRKRDIECALRDARKPQRQRMNFRHGFDAGCHDDEPVEMAARPSNAHAFELSPRACPDRSTVQACSPPGRGSE